MSVELKPSPPGGFEYARADRLGHRLQWLVCRREAIGKGKGCLFGWELPFGVNEFQFFFHSRLKSSSEEQENVKEGVSYCIIIQESRSPASDTECCTPKVTKTSWLTS